MMNYDEAKKAFIQTVEQYAYRYQAWEIFTDFCHIAAISLYQPFARDAKLEEDYLQTIGKYRKEEHELFAKLLSYTVMALSDTMGDFLGECFMELALGNKYKGQFFTPYHISKLMAQLLGGTPKPIETLSEPACGAGGMIIARADALQELGVNYQQVMEVQAIDIDALCVDMCYIQLTLLHISAEVIHGNSLSFEIFRTWYTPAYILKAAHRQIPNWEKIKEPVTKVTVPDDRMASKILYTQDQLEVFATGRLFV